MATIAFSAVGSAVGGSILPTIGPLTGAAIGRAAGAFAGRYVDQALFGSSGQQRVSEGPRLSDLNVTTSSEGTHIPRVYGAARVAGDVIWATNYEEEIITRTQSTGQSGGGKGASTPSSSTKTIQYNYYANFAIALSEGVVNRLGKVWANGKELNLSQYTYRFHKGTETQAPDSLIEAKEGSSNAPAYKGVCYIVFERMPLAEFGNRIPQLNFEIFRQLDEFESDINAITLIPSAGEYVYENEELLKDLGNGSSEPVNTHTHQGKSDWDVAIDQLEDDLPNAKNISLFVSWFGSDLRVGNCEVKPAVDSQDKLIFGRDWLVSNTTRNIAPVTSLDNGRPAYGGTPSDETIINAITDLKSRGLNVTFNPFLLMDIEASNSLPDPYTGNPYQPRYPWRGRITVDPAPGQPSTPDKTSTAISQLNNFIGQAAINDFLASGSSVTYQGPAEWTWRRMVLHYAHLCQLAGGVDSFIIDSEMRGLTTIRDEANNFPFVNALLQLAADVKTILGSTCKVTYAADWSEYFGYQPTDGSNDVFFHLDELWSSPNIDAIGIDCYWPLSDWRTGNNHLDAAEFNSIYEQDYLQGNIFGGEGYDWYYASEEDRTNQIRTPITDGSNKPWVFRYKDVRSWWSNQHYNRPNGTEVTTATSWVPQSKPIWLMEVGCPAIHLGSNQPNVFVDPKSSESKFPYHSDGGRDDYIQRQYIKAINQFFTPYSETFDETNNPQSSQYQGRMVDHERIYIYTWDARPFPAFPANTEIWGDGENWLKGHWLTGRTGNIALSSLVNQILQDYQFTKFDIPELDGIITGYVIDRIMPARDALQPLELAHFFDSFESEGRIKFRHRSKSETNLEFTPDQLVEVKKESPLFELTRAQESELPRSAKITFIDGKQDYKNRTLEGQQTVGKTNRVATADLPIVMDPDLVQSLANKWVHESWASREEGNFALPPSMMALEPTDSISLNLNGDTKNLRITEINDQASRAVLSKSIDLNVYDETINSATLPTNTLPTLYGPSKVKFYDFPLLREEHVAHQPYVGAQQKPWPGSVALYTSPGEDGYQLNTLLNAPARMGTTQSVFNNGPVGRWDYGNTLQVQMDFGELSSIEQNVLFAGSNLAAIEHDNGLWEIIQFLNANLIGENLYELSGFLRAQGGTEDALAQPASTGAHFILIDEALAQPNLTLEEVGLNLNWRYGPAQYSLGHPSFQTETPTFTKRGLKPFSPVHIKGNYNNGDLLISWIRRSRSGGDSWELNEIPLGEETESYEIDVMDGGNVIRTLQSTTTSVTYSETDQIADWGAAQSSYTVRIYQLSEIYGRGSPGEATITNL